MGAARGHHDRAVVGPPVSDNAAPRSPARHHARLSRSDEQAGHLRADPGGSWPDRRRCGLHGRRCRRSRGAGAGWPLHCAGRLRRRRARSCPLDDGRGRWRRRRARAGGADPEGPGPLAAGAGRLPARAERNRLIRSMNAYAPLLASLVALLVGLTIGKAWERYKLRDGTWIDRRRVRESPHYILGLNFLVANQIDLAIEELTQAASLDAAALEVHMILGNLYREKGQVGKAITVHQGLLQRPRLGKLEHAYVLLCLGLDYKRGGFVDRALEAFNEALRLDPQNEDPLLNLQKLHEEQHQWLEGYDKHQPLTQLSAVRT